jgi:hypothetical protein
MKLIVLSFCSFFQPRPCTDKILFAYIKKLTNEMQVSRHSTIAFEDKTKYCARSMSRDDPTQPPCCLLCQSL